MSKRSFSIDMRLFALDEVEHNGKTFKPTLQNKVVYSYLSALQSPETPLTLPLNDIAKDLGIGTIQTARREIKSLVEFGWITVIGNKATANTYIVNAIDLDKRKKRKPEVIPATIDVQEAPQEAITAPEAVEDTQSHTVTPQEPVKASESEFLTIQEVVNIIDEDKMFRLPGETGVKYVARKLTMMGKNSSDAVRLLQYIQKTNVPLYTELMNPF